MRGGEGSGRLTIPNTMAHCSCARDFKRNSLVTEKANGGKSEHVLEDMDGGFVVEREERHSVVF